MSEARFNGPPQSVREHIAQADSSRALDVLRRLVNEEELHVDIPQGKQSNARAIEVWNEFRDQRFALEAYFIEEIFSHTDLDSDFPSGTFASHSPSNTFKTLTAYTGALLNSGLTYWKYNRERSLERPARSWTARDRYFSQYREMTQFYADNFVHPEFLQVRDVTILIGNGMYTGEKTSWSIVECVPRMAHEAGFAMTVEEADDCIRRALRGIGGIMSAMNIRSQGAITDTVFKRVGKEQILDESYFSLRREGGRYVLQPDWEKIVSIVDSSGVPIFGVPEKMKTIGCAAGRLASELGQFPIRDIQEWIADLAKDHYLPQVCA